MAVGIVAGTAAASRTASQAVSLTSLSLAAGDVTIIVFTTVSTGATINTPSGWTPILASTQMEHTTSGAHAIFARAWQSGDPTSVSITTTATGQQSALPFKVTGALATAVVEGSASVYTVNADIAAGGDIPAPGKSPVDSRFLIVTYGLRSSGTTGTTLNVTHDADVVPLMGEDTNEVGFNNAYSAVGYKVLTGTTTTTPKVAHPNSLSQVIATSFLIEPAVVTTVTQAASGSLAVTSGRSASATQTLAVPQIFTVGGIGIDDNLRALPTPPLNVGVDVASHRLDITWEPPNSPGDGTVRAYNLVLTSATENPRTATVTLPGALVYTFNGLTNNTQYDLQIRAVSEYGAGAAAFGTGAPAVPDVPPDPVTDLLVKGLDRAIYVDWSAPLNTGTKPLTGYRVTATQAGQATALVVEVDNPEDTDAVVAPLFNDVAVTISVVAITAGGTSIEATGFGVPTATPVGEIVPGPVVALAVEPRDQGFTASWLPPTELGSRDLFGYEVTATDGDGRIIYYLVGPSTLSGNFASLANDALYTITVRARSFAGYGTASQVGLDLTGRLSTLAYPWIHGSSDVPVTFSDIEQAPYVPPDPGLPIPIWYAFPVGSVFAPANFGKASDDVTVVYG